MTIDTAAPPAPHAERRQILVADDEPHIGRIIQLKLERAPFDVNLVADGRAAIERLESDEPIDLVLLDIMMPYFSGLEVLAKMKEIPHRREVPVIILTAKGQDPDRQQAMELGAVDFFTKPFSPNKLLVRINEILS
ncbi:MAG TPA: response regulator [Longimicrobiaceae bacterium]|nr:response regulator [Longimicrobiaceae bacterium]